MNRRPTDDTSVFPHRTRGRGLRRPAPPARRARHALRPDGRAALAAAAPLGRLLAALIGFRSASFPVTFGSRKADLRSIAAHANPIESKLAYRIEAGRTVGGPPLVPIPNKVGAGWHQPTDFHRSADAFTSHASRSHRGVSRGKMARSTTPVPLCSFGEYFP